MALVLKTYYQLTKPGIIYGNLMTATAGFLLASEGQVNFGLLLVTLTGIGLVIASGCVFNNYLDRDIDRHMARTKNRALASGNISVRSALTYAGILAILGFLLLGVFTNGLTVIVGLIGFVDYVIFYSFYKRRSTIGTVVGSIAGATPIVAGYTAANGSFDAAAFTLFLILVFWQMPHFYSIAIRRRGDYESAHLPVLPVTRGAKAAKQHTLIYVILFILSSVWLTAVGATEYFYLSVMLLLGIIWFSFALEGFSAASDEKWARKMFLYSLIVLSLFSLMLSLEWLLP